MSTLPRRLQLLPREDLVKTGPVDVADWNYRPVLGWIQRLRFRLVLSLLPERRAGRILEIGYGSGVFLLELAKRAHEVFGLDVHGATREVADAVARHGVRAQLFTGSMESLPFPDRHFDTIVGVSCLEFVDDLEAGCREIERVLAPGGSFVTVTPGTSPVLDAGLALLTGRSAKGDFGDRRTRIIPTLTRQFHVDAIRHFPPVLPEPRLYTALRLSRRAS